MARWIKEKTQKNNLLGGQICVHGSSSLGGEVSLSPESKKGRFRSPFLIYTCIPEQKGPNLKLLKIKWICNPLVLISLMINSQWFQIVYLQEIIFLKRHKIAVNILVLLLDHYNPNLCTHWRWNNWSASTLVTPQGNFSNVDFYW